MNWLKLQVLDDYSVCESLQQTPSLSSQYLTNFSCSASLPGDINNDSLVNVQDIILVVNLILANDYALEADLNSDNIINVLDVVQVVNIILG